MYKSENYIFFQIFNSQYGKLPVIWIWSRVLLSPYLSIAWLPNLNPSPYAEEVSDSIWCLKKSPSFFSKSDRLPFFVETEEEEGDDEDKDDVEDDAPSFPNPE